MLLHIMNGFVEAFVNLGVLGFVFLALIVVTLKHFEFALLTIAMAIPVLAVFIQGFLVGFADAPPPLYRNFEGDWFAKYVLVQDNYGPKQTGDRHRVPGRYWLPTIPPLTAGTQADDRKRITAFTASALKRGLSTVGLTPLESFKKVALFFPQLIIGSIYRSCQYLFRFGKYRPTKGTKKNNYLCIINTSLGSYWDKETNNFVYNDIIIVSNRSQGRMRFRRIDIVCDHEKMEVLRMELIIAANHVTGADEVRVLVTCPDELSTILLQIGALKTHGQLHWWGNGVGSLTKKQWPLKDYSNTWVQFLNYLATFQSLYFYHGNFKNDTTLLAHDVAGGVPFAHMDMPKSIWKNSVMHVMVTECRSALQTYFDTNKIAITSGEMNSLLAATVWHSADHYYIDKYTAVNGISKLLQNDFRAMRVGITGGYDWWFTKFKCRQFPNDPVCRIIYTTCLKHDRDFANNGLTMGIAI
jgi:hypothetical protein